MKYRMKDLENFAATAGCRSLSEASRKLEISQPALSESIQRLEEDLGLKVLYRSRSGIGLTPRGRSFLTKVQKLLQSAMDLEIENSEKKIFSGQHLIIGCHTVVANYCLPPALKRLSQLAPDYEIKLVHDLSRNIQNQIQKGQIDFGIVINPVSVPDLVIKKIHHDVVGVWRTKGSFQESTLILNPQLFQSQAILAKWKNRPQKFIETESLDLICQLTASGLGYGIIPTKAVEIYSPKLEMLSQLPTFRDELAIVYRPEFGKNPAEKALLSAFKLTQ